MMTLAGCAVIFFRLPLGLASAANLMAVFYNGSNGYLVTAETFVMQLDTGHFAELIITCEISGKVVNI